MLDAVTADRLVTLRSVYQLARDRTQDPTPAGRHAALVLLDGSCELGLRHAADRLGVKINPADSLEGIHDKVEAALAGVGHLDGWAGVRQMRRGRNQAQHAGVLPDRAQLEGWATDCWTFLEALVETTFDVALTEVHLADALTTPILRQLFAEAETSFTNGDNGGAVTKAWETFNAAWRSWRDQRTGLGLGAQRPTPAPLASGTRAVENAVGQLWDLIEVQAFTSDVGEFMWLASLAARPGPEASATEAQRALVFVFEWILRWEAFSARLEEGLVKRWARGLRPPSTPHFALGPRLDMVTDVVVSGSALPGSTPFVNVRLQLVDAPLDGFELWLVELQEALVQQWKTTSPVETYAFPQVDRRGVITLPFERPDVDASGIVSLIRAAIEVANRRIGDGTESEAVQNHRLALSALIDQDGLPLFPEAKRSYVEADNGTVLRPATELVPRDEIQHLVGTPMFAYLVSTALRSAVTIGAAPVVIRVERSVDPAALTEALRHAVISCREHAAQSSEELRLQREIAAGVRDRFETALRL